MGDKAQAKQFMREAGLPCIPGYDGDAQDAATLAAGAARIGYPVIVKATAGGGGRGMRVVASAEEFDPLLESARCEARNAFGDDRMLVERVVRHPRHIGIQVQVDRAGHGVYFGERDCSVQRRYQKVISPYYDSMFAKLIAHGRDRDEARRKLAKALRETVVFGVKTNRQSLIRFLEHPAFAAGAVDTGFLQQHMEALAPCRTGGSHRYSCSRGRPLLPARRCWGSQGEARHR